MKFKKIDIKLFTATEKELLAKAERTNSDELLYWRMPNIVYPFAVILLALVCYFLFKPDDKFTWEGLVNILFNGTLPMVALNRMSSLGSNLFKFNITNEKTTNTNTTPLRVKIDDYSKLLIICISVFFIFQVIKGPFIMSWWLFLQVFFSIIFIHYALQFSKYAYLLQERLLERTIGDDIRDEAIETKKNLSEKYGD